MTSSPPSVELRPTAMAAGGDAIARESSGRVVFVTGALPEELVRAEVTAERRDYARARILEVLDPSPHRVAPPCPEVARGCGGCQWQHVTLDGQRQLKGAVIADALHRIGRVDDIPMMETVALPATGYRTSVRAAVVGGRAGYRRSASHEAVAVESCLVTHPLVAELLVDGRYPGAIEVVLRCGARTGERLAAPDPADAPTVVPLDVRRDHVHELAAGRRWRISAGSFFQGRPDGADALAAIVADAAAGVGPPGAAIDLYSGVGLFAGVLADQGWAVTAVEGSSAAIADAEVNLGDHVISVEHADVTRWTPPGGADLVIADPSRSGLGRPGTAVVVATGARRLVLVSCDAAALARDTALLRDAGYRLASVTPVDLFPHTAHVEVVSTFDR